MGKFYLYLVSGLVLTLGACVNLIDIAPVIDETFLNVTGAKEADVQSLKRGRRLYVSRCGSCHSLDSVGAYSYIEWIEILREQKMASKSKLSLEDEKKLLLYLKRAISVQRYLKRGKES